MGPELSWSTFWQFRCADALPARNCGLRPTLRHKVGVISRPRDLERRCSGVASPSRGLRSQIVERPSGTPNADDGAKPTFQRGPHCSI